MTRQGVTIRDVARRAGVSTAAVSFALNGTGTLSVATRERIRAIAGELGYQADALARGLRRSPMGAVGLVLRSLDALADYAPPGVDVFERFVGVAASHALGRGLSLMLVPDLTRPPVPPLAFSMDGYIVTNPHIDDPVVKLLESREIPYVTLGRDLSRPEFTQWASEDDGASARLVLDHLAQQGARTVAFVRGTDSNAWNADSEAAYRAWCSEMGVVPRIYQVPERAGVDGGRAVAPRIADDGVPDAVFCLTGRHAAGMLEGLESRGISVPERTMVAAGSDSEHARSIRPAISAIEMNPIATTTALLELLVGRIAGAPLEGPRLVQARFHARASTRATHPFTTSPQASA